MNRTARLVRAAGSAALMLLLGACAGTRGLDAETADRAPAAVVAPARAGDDVERRADVRGTIARVAAEMIGVPYRYGGTSPSEGFDCSGLVFYSYARAGLSVPRNSLELFKAAEKIPLGAAAEGDLVFFQDQRKLSHVGIYLGDNRFVHAPSSGDRVRVSTLDSAYYRQHLVGVGRLIAD